MDDRPTKINQVEASQGRKGLGVRYVLGISLGLIIVAGILIYTFVH